VINHLVKRGWTPPERTKKHGRRPHNIKGTSRSAQLKKIEALLTIGARPWKYADVLARQICKVDTIAWVKDEALYKIITALRKQALREGWDLSGEQK
jgi:phage gp16-like protein